MWHIGIEFEKLNEELNSRTEYFSQTVNNKLWLTSMMERAFTEMRKW